MNDRNKTKARKPVLANGEFDTNRALDLCFVLILDVG